MRVRCEDGILLCIPVFPSSHVGCAHRLTTHWLPALIDFALTRARALRS
jgi:hypothetical protein